MAHDVFLIVAPVDPARVSALRTRLNPSGDARHPIAGLAFDRLPMLHFASFVVFDGQEVTERPGWIGRLLGRTPRTFTTGPRLVFESCVDGPRDAYLDALVHLGGAALVDILNHCVDGPITQDSLRAYLDAHIVRPHLHHIGNPGLRADHIRAGHALRETLDRKLDELVRLRRSLDPPLYIADTLRRELNVPPVSGAWHFNSGDPASVPAWIDDPVSEAAARARHWLWLIAVFGTPIALLLYAAWRIWNAYGTLALLAAFVVFRLAGALAKRWFNGRHPPPLSDPARFRTLKELEDFSVQNHMASLVVLKSGWIRRLRTRWVLASFEALYRTIFTDITPGRLRGLQTIHFAHWTVLDLLDTAGRPTGRQALLFLSNYDGSWETYLDDFIAFLLGGVVRLWSNGEGFPWPLDGPTFKTWARACMSPWEHWYQAYPTLTVVNIENNDAIRKGLLTAPRTEQEARQWLLRLGGARVRDERMIPTPGTLDTRDIQGLVFSGYRRLDQAAYVLLRIHDAAAARAWLGTLAMEVTDGRLRRKEELALDHLAINVAFTHDGLARLGLDAQVLHGFPTAFQEGMAPAHGRHRSRALGDVGVNDPAQWRWGSRDKPADILLMVYADDEHALAAAVATRVDAFTARAGVVVDRIDGRFLPPPSGMDPKLSTEHFGFIDGLSQPVIEGTFAASRETAVESRHLLKPGEFVLGYPAGDGTIASGIPVEARLDRHALLPPIAPPLAVGGATSNGDGGAGARDFGRNGTFLVFRQLAQDVAAFHAFTAKASGANGTAPYPAAAGARVAAHVVGRWRDGVPLTALNAPGRATNEFNFSADAHGFACPIGSHVRRANPRDSLLDDAASAQASANRHRLLRRGRSYGPPFDAAPQSGVDTVGNGADPERGLVFICLNADIERQFEFVQQNWINNPCFGGLYAESDPLIGNPSAADGGRLTLQADAVRERIDGIGRYVTVKSGGYFFLPGLSALRYLAHLDSAALPALPAGTAVSATPAVLPASVDAAASNEGATATRSTSSSASAAPRPVQTPTLAFRVLSGVEKQLPKLRLIWAARFPLLLAITLALLLPLSSRWTPTSDSVVARFGAAFVQAMTPPTEFAGVTTLGSSALFVMNGWGLALVSLLASFAAFVVMIAVRLVLAYGWRFDLGRARWTGSAQWLQVFAFQMLALPIVLVTVHMSVVHALANATPPSLAGSRAYWRAAIDLAPAVLVGGLGAIALLMLATSVQALWRGSRPDLFFPPNPLFKNLAGPGAQGARASRLAERLARLGGWIVDSVPEEIGRGYIDYRLRRVLPGHAFASVLAGIVVVLALSIGVALALGVAPGWVSRMPPLAFVLIVLTAAGWTLSALAFFFDRYRIPTFIPVGLVCILIELVRRWVSGA